jgi:intracellular multiplication protein IcmK
MMLRNRIYVTVGFLFFLGLTLSVSAQNSNGLQAVEQLKMFQNQLENTPSDKSEVANQKLGSTTSQDKKQNDVSPTLQNNLDQIKQQLSQMTPGQAKTQNQNLPNPPPSSATNNTNQNITQSVPYQQQGNGTPTSSDDGKMIDELAYEQVEDQLFPMSENQIKDLRDKYQDIEMAKTSVPSPPTPVATSQFVNLSPGSTPPVIRLAQGFVTSLVFLDSTGAPWPISAYDLGDPSTFNIQWDKTGNTLMIQSSKLYNYGNMAVRLEGLNTPVMLTLIPGQKEVDYRVDMRVQGLGPNAQMPVLGDNLPPSANRLLLHVLDGVPPPGSTRLTVSGGDARAWLFRNKMYVRTNLTILSPAWLATMTSADGMHAYEMQKSPVILVTWHGKVMQLKVEGL